jgi:hypothetical protein
MKKEEKKCFRFTKMKSIIKQQTLSEEMIFLKQILHCHNGISSACCFRSKKARPIKKRERVIAKPE